MKLTLTNKLQIFLLIAAVVLLLLMYLSKCSKSSNEVDQLKNLITALQDTLHTYKTEEGLNAGKIQVLETGKAKDFLALQTKDREIQELQEVVRKNKSKLKAAGGSATTGKIETNVKETNPTIITKLDTVWKDSVAYIYPTYEDSARSDVARKWIPYTVKANKDSVDLSIKIKNDFTFVIGTERKKTYADITLLNPYSEVTQLRTYQVSSPPPKKWNISIGGGYGYNQNLQRQFTLGIYGGYSILRL